METDELFDNYGTFIVKLKATFGDINEARTAERKMQKLIQKTSASNYTSEFRQLVAQIDWDNTALKAKYYARLKERVKDKLM